MVRPKDLKNNERFEPYAFYLCPLSYKLLVEEGRKTRDELQCCLGAVLFELAIFGSEMLALDDCDEKKSFRASRLRAFIPVFLAYRPSLAAEFGINKDVVSRVLKAFQTTGTAVRKVGGGRSRTTTAVDDRYIILHVKRGRRQSASVIAQQLSTATGRQVSRFTVARRLHKEGLFACRPERCLPLKVDHRRHRLQWC
ncbi:transposable element Tcb2 transposase [Trichonephila clavipes]|nr:transposable element Tcb2 transposase [Trichonephila clavipes]